MATLTSVGSAAGGAPGARPISVLDWVAALVVVLIWAYNFIIGKIGVMQLPPLLLIGLRFALVAVLLAPFLDRKSVV